MILDCERYVGPCECGRVHTLETKLVAVDYGCLADFDRYMDECGLRGRRVVLYDTNTYNLPGMVHIPADREIVLEANGLDPDTRTLTVRALYPNPAGAVMPGRYVSISLKRQELEDALAVPSEAIIPEMGKDKVFCYRSGKAEPTDIVTGVRTEGLVQVVRGLAQGDTIITSGIQQLRTGMAVSIDRLEQQ